MRLPRRSLESIRERRATYWDGPAGNVARAYARIAKAIRDGERFEPGLDEALELHELLDALQHSSDIRRAVDLEGSNLSVTVRQNAPTENNEKEWRHDHIRGDNIHRGIPEAVWAVMIDGKNDTAWDSGITLLDGEIGAEAKIKIESEPSPGQSFPLKVTEFDAPNSMVWVGGLPFGLFKGVHSFSIHSEGDATRFTTREDFVGPLLPLRRECASHGLSEIRGL